jgi:hypothetical protein
VGIGVLALAVRLALLPVDPIPLPAVHDEFAYLLGAETFASGRVTNPPHPLWVHFETFDEIMQPTYASKYPPAQSAFLALGWKLFGHPWYGVWLSCGVMCAALCWMLQGWVPARYALLGGLLAVAQWGIAGSWIDSYWGGAVAAAAGALAIGAVPRLVRRPRAGVAALAAAGIVLLANSRPYEGAITAVSAAAVVLIWRRLSRRPLRSLLAWRVVAPAGAILGCGLAGMLYYDYRVTGNALEMPYAVHQAQYGAAPIFWMSPPTAAPPYRHDAIRRFWLTWDRGAYERAHAVPLVVPVFFAVMLLFFLTPVSAAAAVGAIAFRRGRKVRFALVLFAVPAVGLLLERFALPHYFAPAAGSLLVLVILGVQLLGAKWGTRAVAVWTVLLLISVAVQRHMLAPPDSAMQAAVGPKVFGAQRRHLADELEGRSGRHLVIVRYAPDHDVMREWVYNHADIDGSTVVWARDMGEARNRELLDYYRGRKVWLLEADSLPAALTPYPAAR